ncbi:hypothetical protein ACOME3_009007 [Neoechinorhynchus agilis]
MTQYLPLNLFALFAPRDPVPYLPPATKLPHERRVVQNSGLQDCISLMEELNDAPVRAKTKSRRERNEIKKRLKIEMMEAKNNEELEKWDPKSNPNATSDPYKTLFVGRLVSEGKALFMAKLCRFTELRHSRV